MMNLHIAPLASARELVRLRLNFVRLLALFNILVGVMLILSELAHEHPDDEAGHSLALFIAVAFIATQGVVLNFLRQNRPRAASIALVVSLAALSIAAEYTLAEEINIAFVILTVIASAVLAPFRVFVVVNLLAIGELGYDVLREGSATETAEALLELIPVVSLAFVSIATRGIIETTRQSAESAQRTADLLQASAVVGQFTSRLLNLNELLGQSIELIRRRFDFYHVQVFLLNETRDQAVLVASTGEVGRQLLARAHRLAVGSQSVIGQVTLRGEPIVAGTSDKDTVHARNELLPDTRSELALPILDGDEIIGALDVQSTRAGAFSPDDVRALEITANLLATAIRNARLFEEQDKVAKENERLLREAQAGLSEIERLNRQLTGTSWQEYLTTQSSVAGVTMVGNQLEQETTWTPELLEASASRRPVMASSGGKQIVAVPVILRGEVIGAIEVEPDRVPEAETVDMVQAVAERLAVSLDNARLFEEAQGTTAQEHYINDIVARYQAVNSVDDLLRITLTELSQTLGAQRGAIRLGRFHDGGEPDAN